MKKVLAVFLISLLCACAGNNVYRPQVTAHRGASGYLPEHTLEAKAYAHALAPDYVEQDVVITKDNVLMVTHDVKLETTTNIAKKFPSRHRKDGSYYAIDFTLAELKSLTLTERFNSKTGKAVFSSRFPVDSAIDFKMPTLEEEFTFIQGLNKSTGREVGVYTEVKEPQFHEREGKDILAAVIKMLEKYGYNKEGSKAVLQIFSLQSVKRARELGWKGDLAMLITLDGQWLYDDKAEHKWLLTEEGIAYVSKYATIYAPGFTLLAVPDDAGGYTLSNAAQVAHKYGMKVHTWTHRVDSPSKGFKTSDEMLDTAFKQLKIDGIFSDFPDNVIKYLKAHKMR